MHARIRVALVIVVAAVAGWVVRGIEFEQEPPTTPAIVSRADGAGPSIAPPRKPVVVYATREDDVRLGSRNVFAYVDRPRKAPEPGYAATRLAPEVLPGKAELATFTRVTPEAPQPPRFAHRYIGTFGTHAVRLAAFSRDGEVITARAGDRIDADFTLQSIGIESVEVLHDSTRTTQRIEMWRGLQPAQR